jgi:hypothetical protein
LIEIRAQTSGLSAILEFEMIFNYLTLKALAKFSVDQRSWPGKGLDTPLYTIGS